MSITPFSVQNLALNFIRLTSNPNQQYFNKKTMRKKLICILSNSVNDRRSVDTFRDYKYLGTRVRVDGTVGE